MWELPPDPPKPHKPDLFTDYWCETAFRTLPKPQFSPEFPLNVNEFGDKIGPKVTYSWPKATKLGVWELERVERADIPQELVRELKRQRMSYPEGMQLRVLQEICKGGTSVVVRGTTGSGKTLAYVLGSLSLIDRSNPAVQVLCVSPTVELNAQIARLFWIYGQSLGVSVSMISQVWVSGQVVVLTPGQLEEMIWPGALPWLRLIILDEADWTLHLTPITPTLHSLFSTTRVIMVSSTFNDEVLDTIDRLFPICERLTVPSDELLPDTLDLYFTRTEGPWQSKIEILDRILSLPTPGVTLIFVNSVHTAEVITQIYRRHGVQTGLLTETTMTVIQRRNVLTMLHKGVVSVVVTTDWMSRGIDEPRVSRVVNFDLPVEEDTGLVDAETFLRRVGRTSRFGRPGIAVTIVTSEQEVCMLEDVMMYWGCRIQEW